MPFVTAKNESLKSKHLSTSRRNKWSLIILGSVVWAVTAVKSGLIYNFGMGFWGPHGHDGVWHISLIRSLALGTLAMPIFAGENIKNYHLGFDLLVAVLHRFTALPITFLYFQLLPLIFALLIGLQSYKLVYTWTKSTLAAWWAVFFVYFAGSWGWILGQGESAFWSQQAISTLVNPPFALSLVLLLWLLLSLQNHRYLFAGLILAALPHVKIYAGLLALTGLFAASLKHRSLFKTLAIGAILYSATNYRLLASSSSLIVWQPGWFLEHLFAPDRLNWPQFFSALNTYRVGHIWFKAIPAYLLALIIFLIGNLGTRIASLLLLKFRSSAFDWLYIFFISATLVGIGIPQLFLQTGTAWNTIQFFYYSLFLLSLLAGIAWSQLITSYLTRKWLITGLSCLIIVLTLPTSLDTLRHYLPSRPPAKISLAELEALDYLSRLPRGLVLTPPATPDPYAPPPRPLYLYESTAYVSAFSGQPVFLEDEVNLNITGYDWRPRHELVAEFFTTRNHQRATQFLSQNQIIYLYSPVSLQPALDLASLGLLPVFANSEVVIWKTP